MKKRKILMLSDHALSTSGVGTQSRHLINGLLEKGCWSIRQFGAAMKHTDYNVVKLTDDFIIRPIDGFGNKEILRLALATEKPDVLFIFTDPRFFYWLFEMEDEIHQICPIVYWHVWDNKPFPEFNRSFYESTDLINCHSHHTYLQLKDEYPEKTNFVPHTLPPELFYKLSDEETRKMKSKSLGEQRKDWFTALWVNRNARRKRPADVLWGFKMFLDRLEAEEGHKEACIIMHTDPLDNEGPNLFSVSELLGIENHVVFSTQRVDFNVMNQLHNIADVVLNISYAEGFGLSTLEAMQAGTPIIAGKTGGQTIQVVDSRDGSENGVALDIKMQTLVGSQQVPYIFEDYVDVNEVGEALWTIYSKTPAERKELSKKVMEYVQYQFNYQDMVDKWHNTMLETIDNWEQKYDRWTLEDIND